MVSSTDSECVNFLNLLLSQLQKKNNFKRPLYSFFHQFTEVKPTEALKCGSRAFELSPLWGRRAWLLKG